jgi:hypothetical protein
MITLLAYNAEASVAYFKKQGLVRYLDALTRGIYDSSEEDLKSEAAYPPWQHRSMDFPDDDALIEWLQLLD